MSTKRRLIDSLREKIRERNADSRFSNQFLYQTLLEQAKWIIRRETTAGRIWASSSLFQSYTVRILEVSLIDSCLPITSNCKIYRSAEKMPELWEDTNGPMFKTITSVDGSTDFYLTTPSVWMNRKKDPYRKKGTSKYAFYMDGYLWIPEHNPHYVKTVGYYIDDISLVKDNCLDCDEDKDCVRFLDTPFTGPEWIEAEIISKSLELLFNSKKLPEDEQIDKNPTRKN